PRREGSPSDPRQAQRRAHRAGPRPPSVRRRRLGRLLLSVGVQHPRLRAARRADPSAAALPPDVRGRRLRRLLLLSPSVRLRPGRRAGAVQPLERDVRGSHLLRELRIHEPQGHRIRLDHAPSRRHPPRPPSGPRGGVDREEVDRRARGDGRHLPPADGRPRGAAARGQGLPPLLARRGRLRMSAVRTLLQSLIDYAGLFPPAGLDMETSVRNYARYRSGEDRWALGKFIVPASRLAEFERTASPHVDPANPWPLSVLGGSDLNLDLAMILEHRYHPTRGLAIESL